MKIGLLNAYHFDGVPDGYQSQYRVLFEGYFRRICPRDWHFELYEVAQNQFPASLEACDGWVIGGSGKSCYEDEAWIARLSDWVQACFRAKRKLCGICFGHQLIAQALGGQVQRSDRGWGVGVRTFQFIHSPPWHTADAAAPPSWMQHCSLIFSHQDQVTALPAGATRYATDAFCPIQSFGVDRRVFTLQGHPEITAAFARERLRARQALMAAHTVERAWASLDQAVHDDEVGDLIVRFFEAPISESDA
ncbi:MAG: hypothetical protein P8176_03030 [Gammaproteobacteria bacterium]